jgi:hypothetical protein
VVLPFVVVRFCHEEAGVVQEASPTETISQHRAVIFGHALHPPLVKIRRSFPPGEAQRIDKMKNMKKSEG